MLSQGPWIAKSGNDDAVTSYGEAGTENPEWSMDEHWKHGLAGLLGKILTAEEEWEITQEEGR